MHRQVEKLSTKLTFARLLLVASIDRIYCLGTAELERLFDEG
jgi:hypothetical protein